jgi:hypothetical protein
MNAFLTFRGRRFLPLLAMCCVLAGFPRNAHADLLTSRLTNRATLTSTGSAAPIQAARVVYESQGENDPPVRAVESSPHGALAAAALILVIPAGTMAVSFNAAPPPPPPPPPTTSPPTSPGDGHTSGVPPTSGTPEPGSLVLALTGSGTMLLGWLRRRRSVLM